MKLDDISKETLKGVGGDIVPAAAVGNKLAELISSHNFKGHDSVIHVSYDPEVDLYLVMLYEERTPFNLTAPIINLSSSESSPITGYKQLPDEGSIPIRKHKGSDEIDFIYDIHNLPEGANIITPILDTNLGGSQ